MPLKKIGKAIKKTVRKIVPKEVAGIMQVAAPFVAPYSLPGALALSIGGQLRQGQGRISPFKTLLAVAPSEQFRSFTRGLPGGQATDQFLYGTAAGVGGPMGSTDIAATQGLIGTGGEFGLKEFMGGSLLSPGGKLSKSRVAGLIAGGASLAMTNKQMEEEGEAEGLGPDEISLLQAEAADIFRDFDTTAFRPQVTARNGGLMRLNLREGSKGDELPPDPTKPIGVPPGFKPKPIGPVLPDKAKITVDSMAMDIFGMSFNELSESQQNAILELMGMGKPQAQQGGLMRTNYALGTRPTAEETGLGGLPIEADMRYTGGFMPYGEKEKADDVPARLSKNEFVFTADAVRAAGGGSVQKGAKKMYSMMKNLETQPEAKGIMA